MTKDETAPTTDMQAVQPSGVAQEGREFLPSSISTIEQRIDELQARVSRLKKLSLREQEDFQDQDNDTLTGKSSRDFDTALEKLSGVELEIVELEERLSFLADSVDQAQTEPDSGDQVEGRQQLPWRKISLAYLQERAEQGGQQLGKALGRSGRLTNGQMIGLLLLALLVSWAGVYLLFPTGSRSKEHLKIMVETAALYQNAGRNGDAGRILDEVMNQNIKDPHMLGRIGETYRLINRYDQAISVLNKAVKREPRNESYRLSLARSYGSAGMHHQAITQYQVVIDIKPDNVWYYAEIGHQYKSLKDYETALIYYQKMLAINSDIWHSYYYQGEVYREQENYDDAIGMFLKAAESDPQDMWFWIAFGQTYLNGKGNRVLAIEQYQKAVNLFPDHADPYFYIGEAYLSQGYFEQAIEPYQQAIANNKMHLSAHLGLGKIYIFFEECHLASKYFERVLLLNSNHAEAQEGLAACRDY